MDDYEIDFSELIKAAGTDKIEKIRFYTEIESIKSKLSGNPKFEAIAL
jgi:CRISPR-associated protein Csh2